MNNNMTKSESMKKWLPDVVVVVLFALIAFAYFFPADVENRILFRHDASAGVGAGQEASEYLKATGERTRWTNSTFSGMPTYQTAPSYSSTDGLGQAIKAYHLWLPENVWYLFVYLLGFYIMLRAFDFRWHLAALGSVIWAFSSYFLIIIAAGHIWKVMALAYLPPLIGGLALAYRGKYLWGLLVTAVFTAFEVNANHVQMTYYYLFVIVLMIIAWLVESLRQKRMAHFWRATAACIVGGVLGILINISNLYHTWQYGQESMRGKSELVKKDAANQTSSGLDRDYITQWSYGIGETWTLLIPNTKGGASMPLSDNATAMRHAQDDYLPIYEQLGQYWGEQPGTSGPVYVGAFVLMLFVLGLFIVKGPMKWALLAATILSILLSWGKNFMPFTDFFLDYVPMYAKFRTVASILVIAEFTIPLLAMLALRQLISSNGSGHPVPPKYLWMSFGLTAGFCLLFALMPGLFFSDFVSSAEMRALSQFPADQLGPLLANLREVRRAMFTADCWRSFWIIALGMVLLLLYQMKKLRTGYLVGALLVLCLLDLWMVDKRYLNDAMFVEKSQRDAPQTMTPTDEQILKDKSLDYRVLNLASNTFNENETSYYHKSIGGYHAAKLRRYQEMIDAYIMPQMQKMMEAVADAQGDMTQVAGDSIYPVLNMLNTKYIIMPLQGGQTVPLQNPYAYGNAWFVDKLTFVDNANQEIETVGKLNLRHEAVADRRFASQLGQTQQQENSVVTIKAYQPNHLTYEMESDKGGVVVFSEIYYPGWTATIDGQPAELGRVNYILRALNVKAGKHQVELMFYPQSVKTTETIATIAFILLILVALAVIFFEVKKRPASEE